MSFSDPIEMTLLTTPLKYIENEAPPLRTIYNLVSGMVGFSRVTGLIFIHPMGIIPFHQWGTTQWVQGDRESRMAYVFLLLLLVISIICLYATPCGS